MSLRCRESRRHSNRAEDRGGFVPPRRNRVYRSRNGWVMGVCAGFAEHFDFSIFATRLLFVLLSCTIGFPWCIVLYFVMGMLMKKAPEPRYTSEVDEDFWNTYQSSRADALRRVKRAFDDLDHRMQQMESTVTSRNFDLEEEYRRL